MLADKITKDNIETMVMNFYRRVLKDDLVGPYFIEELGDDMDNKYWQPHLKRLVDFWESVVQGDTSYKRNPFTPHMMMEDLNLEVFERWLKLFFETVDEVYEPQIADRFKERSNTIAGNFMRNLGLV
ncbi:MAG: globin [Sulfurovum sp.]|nr:MAG: globin [Sulfurovum sp.]